MKKLIFITIGLVFLFGFFTLIFLSQNKNKFPKACFQKSCFKLEVADSDNERVKGLSYRNSLDQDQGMLFVFEKEGYYSFWMRNTFIPLDIIWLDSDQKVVFMKENAEPCLNLKNCESIISDSKAKYVLELKAESVRKIGLHLYDTITLGF